MQVLTGILLVQGAGDPYFDIYFANESTGWITGYNGLILKTTNGGTTFVNNESGFVSDFRIEQNYPNPFNSMTRINFSLSKSEIVKLSVFDALGKEISVLVSEYKSEGNHTVLWNAGILPSGVYYYVLNVGKFYKTKRMLLLK